MKPFDFFVKHAAMVVSALHSWADQHSLTSCCCCCCHCRVCLQHDLSGVGGMFGSVFLGEVRIPVRDLGLERSCSHQAWYLLQPRSEGQRSPPTATGPSSANGAAAGSLGSLRLKLFFTSDRVFSSHFYMDLRELLLMSPTVKVNFSIL